jgi:hypothetical protein
VPGPVAGQLKRPSPRFGQAVHEEGFEAGVIGEPFDVTQIRHCGGHAGVQGRGAMRRDLSVMRRGECGSAQPSSVPSASGSAVGNV